MKAIVGSSIVIEDCTANAAKYYKSKLTFPNPKYYKAQSMGKWTGKIPKDIVLYQIRGKDMIIPFGMLRSVFKNKSSFDDIENAVLRRNPERFDYKSSITPYDYQKRAIEAAIARKNGVIVAPCGAGKTQIALEIVAQLGLRTLWLTHTTDLMNQSMERAKNNFGLQRNLYGTISAGKVKVGQAITFATVQTMANVELELYKDYWDVVIVDECHKCVGSPTHIMMFYKVVNSLCARYKFGITATPERADGLENCMFSLLGEKIYEITREDVKDTTCPVEVWEIPTNYKPDINRILSPDGTISYTKLIDDVIRDSARIEKIAEDICFMQPAGGVLVLSERVEHLEAIMRKCSDAGIPAADMQCISSSGGTSKAAKESRKNALVSLNNGKIKVLFATYQLAKEGLDVPNLRTLVFASPQKTKTTVIQSVGRVSRKAAGKEKGIVLDYVDNFGLMMGYSKKRDSYYKEIGCDIKKMY